MFLLHPRVKISIVGSLCDREVACSSQVFLAQSSLYVHKGGLKPDSFHFTSTISFSCRLPGIARQRHMGTLTSLQHVQYTRNCVWTPLQSSAIYRKNPTLYSQHDDAKACTWLKTYCACTITKKTCWNNVSLRAWDGIGAFSQVSNNEFLKRKFTKKNGRIAKQGAKLDKRENCLTTVAIPLASTDPRKCHSVQMII